MSIVPNYSRTLDDAGRMDAIQDLTAASTGTPITNYGVTVINTTQAKTYQLAAPVKGLRKSIVGAGGSTAGDITVDGNGATIGGSTQIAFANAVATGVDLVGISTAAWAVIGNNGGTLS